MVDPFLLGRVIILTVEFKENSIMAFSITGQIKVSTLKKRFQKEFGLTLRVFDGRSLADEGQTIGQIRKKKGSGNLSIKENMSLSLPFLIKSRLVL